MVFPSNNAKALDEDFQSVAGEEDAFHVHGVQAPGLRGGILLVLALGRIPQRQPLGQQQ